MNNKSEQLPNNQSLKIGVISTLKNEDTFSEAKKYGLSFCQVVNWNPLLWDTVNPVTLRKEADTSGITVSSFWVGYPGPVKWNFTEGPSTIGIVPRNFRETRKKLLIKCAEFVSSYGALAIVTHAGFIPENCQDPLYRETVDTIEEIADALKSSGIQLWFETGQETPVTLLRLIEDTGCSNLGINLDPANLIMYGKGNPVDALDTIGKFVMSVHVKDGLYPTTGDSLGEEVKPGKGKVDFRRLIARLKELNYNGEYIIEREISGHEQEKDIRETIGFLKLIS